MILRRFRVRLLAVFLFSVCTVNLMAAEQFVSFHPCSDVWQLKSFTVGVSQNEHSCVQLAANNLLVDLEKVTGQKAVQATEDVEILIGTVGVNKQIDQWVKTGVLENLKGKTEKYIIKTIGNQLVIAGSDKRGTVYGIYEYVAATLLHSAEEKGFTKEQCLELRACLMEGLVRADYLLPDQIQEKHKRQAEDRHGKNYWTVMKKIGAAFR